jgi:transposase
VGMNQRKCFKVADVGNHERYMHALFNRDPDACRKLYDSLTGAPSRTRLNTDKLVRKLSERGVVDVIETRASSELIESERDSQIGRSVIQTVCRCWRPAGMSKALSLDLRTRVLAAIAGGLSCRRAAERFGVSPSSAIRWRALEREQGDARPKALGGDRRSGRIEMHAALILALVEETPDITLDELRAALAERGVSVGYGTLWRFFDRRRITLKKRPRTRPSRTARTS